MEYIADLGVFSGKVFVLAFAIAALLILISALVMRARQVKPNVQVENLNEKFDKLERAVKSAVLNPKDLKREAKQAKAKKKKEDFAQKRIFVLDFEGDIRATHVENLREEITTVLTVARPDKDEVVVRLESPGGVVHDYGLAAAQLVRLRQAKVPLTICVDKVAGSGGYMMACTADKIVAAPFAVLGSIGVVAQVPNLHRLLKKNDIDFEEFTAGEFKRTVTMFGEITDAKRSKFKQQIGEIHQLFKHFVKTYRPQLDIDHVATGEIWYGEQAQKLKLVDEIAASDDYLFHRRAEARIFRVHVVSRKKWSEKLAENIAVMIGRAQEQLQTPPQARHLAQWSSDS